MSKQLQFFKTWKKNLFKSAKAVWMIHITFLGQWMWKPNVKFVLLAEYYIL